MMRFSRQLTYKTMRRGTWTPHRTGSTWSALIGCPGCGAILSLDKFPVLDDGTLESSICCPKGGCDWTDTVKIMGWEPFRPPIEIEDEDGGERPAA